MGSGVTRRTDWIGHLLFGLVGMALGALMTASHRHAAEAAVPETAPPAAVVAPAPQAAPAKPTPRPVPVADQPESLLVSGEGVPAELAVGQTASSDNFTHQMSNALTLWLDEPSAPIAMRMHDNMPARYDGQVDAQDLQSLGPATAVRRHLVDLQQWTVEHQTAPARILVRAEVIGCYDFDEKALGTSECRVTNAEE